MYHFDPNRLSITVMGIQLFEFASGEFLTLAPRNKPFTEIEGTHGASVRSGTPAVLYDGTVSIVKGSPINELISAKVALDILGTPGQTGPMLIKDLEGTSLVIAQTSYFLPPEIKGSTEPLVVPWAFVAEIQPGGWTEGANRYLVSA